MPTWIDFKELRSKLDFGKVLVKYGVKVSRPGKQHTGPCPLPGHSGKRNDSPFSANLERGIFNCFGCGAKGNVLDFAVLMEKASTDDGRAVKEIAAKLRAEFFPEGAKQNGRMQPGAKAPGGEPQKQLELSVAVNQPLDFDLKGLNATHPKLSEWGLEPATIAHFGLGYCSRGYLAGRIAIPLRDANGKLIGYAGRTINDAKIDDGNPEYVFPARREREGKTIDFQKSRFLYNGHDLVLGDELTIVEGFPSVWWLWQHRFPRTVATMESACSDEQLELILNAVHPLGRIRIMTDSGSSGEQLAHLLLHKISAERFVRWIKLPGGTLPTDLTEEELNDRLAF